MSKELNIRGYGMINEADGWRSGCLYDSVAFYLDAKGAVPWDTHLDFFCNIGNKTRRQTNMVKIPGRDNPTNTGYRLPDGEEMIVVQIGVHVLVDALMSTRDKDEYKGQNIKDAILLLREMADEQHILFYLDEELVWCQPIFRCVSPGTLRGRLDFQKNADFAVPTLNVPISITSNNKFKVTIEILSLHNFTIGHAKTTPIYVVLHGFTKSLKCDSECLVRFDNNFRHGCRNGQKECLVRFDNFLSVLQPQSESFCKTDKHMFVRCARQRFYSYGHC